MGWGDGTWGDGTYGGAAHTTISAPTATATASAGTAAAGTGTNVFLTVDAATATATAQFAAASPSSTSITAIPAATATATAIEQTTSDPDGSTWGEGAWGDGPWGTTAVDDTLTVTVRQPARITTPATTATATAVAPSRVEAVRPITSLPGAIEGRAPTSTTTATLDPDIEVPTSDVEQVKPANKHYRETVGPDRPVIADPRPRSFQTEETSVYTPAREITINGTAVTADREVRIAASETGVPVADITLYNLDPERWASITAGDRLRVDLGWQQGDTHRVFDGHVAVKRRRRRWHNRGYVIRARDRGAQYTARTVNRTFNAMSPSRIVEHIALDLEGLKPGFIATGTDRLPSAYTLSESQSLGGWLDRLAEKAERQTGTPWVWYTEGDLLSFHPIDAQATEPIELGVEKSIVEITPVGVAETDPSRHRYEVVMRCEPVLERGVAVTVADSRQLAAHELYRIASYTHTSKTTTGRHHTTAVLAPLRKEIEYPTF